MYKEREREREGEKASRSEQKKRCFRKEKAPRSERPINPVVFRRLRRESLYTQRFSLFSVDLFVWCVRFLLMIISSVSVFGASVTYVYCLVLFTILFFRGGALLARFVLMSFSSDVALFRFEFLCFAFLCYALRSCGGRTQKQLK